MVRLGGGADDGGAEGDRQLDGDRTDSTGRAVDQDGLAALQAELAQYAAGRLTGDGERHGLLPGEPGRLRRDHADHSMLGVCTAARPADDLVTDRELGHTLAHLVDHTGDLGPRHGGEGGRHHRLEPATPDLVVHRVHPGRPDRDPHLTLPCMRLLGLLDPEHLRTTELLEHNRSHRNLQHVVESSIKLIRLSTLEVPRIFPPQRPSQQPGR